MQIRLSSPKTGLIHSKHNPICEWKHYFVIVARLLMQVHRLLVKSILHLIYLLPMALGFMMLLSIYKPLNWMARWGIAYTVGMAAGLRAYGILNSNVLGQVKNTIIPVVGTELPFFSLTGDSYFNNLIILVGTVTGLLYFYFSREQTGAFGKVTKIGIYFLMISFGASFGFAVMGRISLLIGRLLDLIKYSGSEFHHATIWVLVAMVLLLGYSAYQERESAG